MAVPTDLTALSVTAASNSPSGSDSIGVSLDDFLRIIQAMLKEAGATLYTAAGTADAITFSTTPTFSAYQTGQRFYFLASGANTGAVTLNINAVGAKAVTREGTNALVAGDIPASAVVCVVYDGTRFILQNVANSYGKFNGSTVTASGLIAAQLGLTVSGAAFTSRGITDNATSTALTIDSSGNALFGGISSTQTIGGVSTHPILAGNTGRITQQRFSADTNTPALFSLKSRSATAGSFSIVSNGDPVWSLRAHGDDGASYNTEVGRIQIEVDGVPSGVADIPGRLLMYTRKSAGALTENFRIANDGTTTLGGTSTAPAFKVVPVASQVNYLQAAGSAAGTRTTLQPLGGDTDIGVFLDAKGAGDWVFRSSGGSATQVQIAHTASANRYITLTGSNGGNPTIGTSAGDLAISGNVKQVGYHWASQATATPAGGSTSAGFLMGSAGLQIAFGSGAPTLTAAKGSLYLRTDGSTTNNRMYVNTDGGTTWTAVTTAA